MRQPVLLKILLPFAVLLVGVLLTMALVRGRQAPERASVPALPPVVRAQVVTFQDVRMDVTSQGEVAPRTQTELVAQVSGQITEVSPSLVAGGFFRKGEVLARIDAADFRLAVTSAEAAVARAELVLAQQEQEAELASKEWEELGDGEAGPLVLREPQLAEARASLASARALLEKARLDLGRTALRVPYDGRVREKFVDVGQFVAPGARVARVYSTDAVEIRLAVPPDELRFLALDPERMARGDGPPVQLGTRSSADGSVQDWKWTGRIVRTEGVIDPMTRMVHVVARMESPGTDGPGIGQFVNAKIQGRTVNDAVVLPRAAMRDAGLASEVLLVDDENRLRTREVSVLRVDRLTAVVNAGLSAGERVCYSPLEVSIDGMTVRVHQGAETGESAQPMATTEPMTTAPSVNTPGDDE
jgi:RND family efflux transporter MFP subunit